MQVESILRLLHPIPGFVYAGVELRGPGRTVVVSVRPRAGSRGCCAGCGQKRPGYDTGDSRVFSFVPLWGLPVVLLYAMRRVNCPKCGVKTEMVPWAEGKSHATLAYVWFLASWAKVLSWRETAKRFKTSWDTVFRAVEHAVRWGLEHRNLDGIRSIGVDELAWKKGHKYLTLVYQIDHGCRRLLHIAKDRQKKSFAAFFDMLGKERSKQIAFVASDMWKAFLTVVQARCSQAVHVLDRFHVMQLFSKAVDEVRRQEARTLRERGDRVTLKHARWPLLKRPSNLTEKQRGRLAELLRDNLRSVRAYLLKEYFQMFWGYTMPYWAGRFLDRWTHDAVRSTLEPFGRLARTLRQHREPLLNWFRARHAFAHGAVEGFNNKARVTTRIAYGFRSYEHAEIALFHRLGGLPEPDWPTHRFC